MDKIVYSENGWIVKRIYQSANEYGQHDYSIKHHLFFPNGYVLMDTNLKSVLEFIKTL